MASNPKKRTLDSFFAPKVKKVKVEEVVGGDTGVEEAVDENSEDSHVGSFRISISESMQTQYLSFSFLNSMRWDM